MTRTTEAASSHSGGDEAELRTLFLRGLDGEHVAYQAFLQKLSVLYYVQSLCPVPAPMDSNAPALFRLLLAPAEPAAAWAAILGIAGVTALVLWVASIAVRRLEINYGTE